MRFLFPDLKNANLAILHLQRWVVLLLFYAICLYWFRFPEMFTIMLPVMVLTDVEYGSVRLSRQVNYIFVVIGINLLCIIVTIYQNNWFLISLIITILGVYFTCTIALYDNGFFPLAFCIIMTPKSVFFKHYQLYQLSECLFTLNIFAVFIYFINFFILPAKNVPQFEYVKHKLKFNDYKAIIRSFCSFFSAMLFINYYNLTLSSFILTTIILLSIPSAGESVSKLLHRIVGTIIGVFVGGILFYINSGNILFYIFCFIFFTGVGFFLVFTSYYSLALIFITAMIVSSSYIFSAFDPSLFINITPANFLMDRFFNVLVGCIIVIIFTILIPETPEGDK